MIPRILAQPATAAFTQYPIVTLTGPRQSGKTTLARATFDLPYVNLEAPDRRRFAQEDPRGFLAGYPTGAILDEVQRVPELASYLQERVDEVKRPGQYLLTGSHNFVIREQLSQSLAGRTALLTLLPFSNEELADSGIAHDGDFGLILRGGYPRIYEQQLEPSNFYRDYVGTYIERDLRQLSAVRDIAQFQQFMQLCAANVGQLLNLSRLANDCGISQTTASEWLTLMEASYVVYRLRPWFTNTRKRLVKHPKLYFYDTGVASFLLGLTESDHVANHPLRGALFENLVINEVLKFDLNRNRYAELYFYRDNNGNEVDLLYRRDQRLLPVEIKSGQTVTSDYLKGIEYFNKNFGGTEGLVVYRGSEAHHRSDGTSIVPANEVALSL